MQGQRRASAEAAEMVGLVESSRARMAESRSFKVDEAPCIAVPPAMKTFVDPPDLAGDAVRGVDALELLEE